MSCLCFFTLTSFILGVHRNRPLILGVVATNLLRARNDPDAQRLWMGDIHSILGNYPRKSEVTSTFQLSSNWLMPFGFSRNHTLRLCNTVLTESLLLRYPKLPF